MRRDRAPDQAARRARMAEERVPSEVRCSKELPPRAAMEEQLSEMTTFSVGRKGA